MACARPAGGCGAKGKAPWLGANPDRPPALIERRAINAAVCHCCIYAEHDPDIAGVGAVACTVSGKPITAHLLPGVCPKGKHARKEDGVTVWAWLRWRGLAYPMALWVWATTVNHPRPGAFYGCGCSVALSGLWAGLRGAARGREARNPGKIS